ncbi:MAG TPA: TPM domain-containing protein [Chthoniobacterales bacterium]|nr:TPM domain-containing protein [Chthoniobacterales bacterium]
MRPKDFLHRLNHQRIIGAIKEAEGKTSGEIRIFIDRSDVREDPLAFAEKKFLQLGMHKTADRNAILIFVAPRSQKFAVVGDEGVHKQCGPEFWQQMVADMRVHFQQEEFTDAIVLAIDRAGELLARHFPRQHDDRNELPDAPVEH